MQDLTVNLVISVKHPANSCWISKLLAWLQSHPFILLRYHWSPRWNPSSCIFPEISLWLSGCHSSCNTASIQWYAQLPVEKLLPKQMSAITWPTSCISTAAVTSCGVECCPPIQPLSLLLILLRVETNPSWLWGRVGFTLDRLPGLRIEIVTLW